MFLLYKENIWLNCAEYSATFACANNPTIMSDAMDLHILNFDVRSHPFVTISPIENHALFRPNCAFERCSSVNPFMCFLHTPLSKGNECRRGETNLNTVQLVLSGPVLNGHPLLSGQLLKSKLSPLNYSKCDLY